MTRWMAQGSGVLVLGCVIGGFQIAASLALLCPLLVGAACEKKKPNDTGAISAMDRAGSGSATVGPTDTTPMKGIDLGKLDGEKQKLFYALVGSLKSPCGNRRSSPENVDQYRESSLVE